MAKLLHVEGRADIGLRNSLDQTALVVAEMARHRRIVDLLRRADALDVCFGRSVVPQKTSKQLGAV